MKDKIKSHIISILTHNTVKKQTVQEIIQNNHKGTRPREINLAMVELISEYKIELCGDALELTEKYKKELHDECVIGIEGN